MYLSTLDDRTARILEQRWAVHLGVLAALTLLLGAVYWTPVVAAVEVWWVSPTFSHCFIIIPISAYLIWRKREDLRGRVPVFFPQALLFAIPFLLLWVAGAVASINEAQQLAVMGLFQVLVLTALGPSIYRIILFPSLFLFALVPLGEYLVGPLQNFTTRFIDVGLTVLGVVHYTEGTLIQLANGSFEVAEACAGLRFLIATVVLSVLFAHLTYRKWSKIIIFVLASLIVPIIGNGLRALGIVLLAHWTDNRVAVGADHLIYGWGFSVALLLLLFFIGSYFQDPENPQSANVGPSNPSARPASPASIAAVAIAAALTISAGPAFAWWGNEVSLPSSNIAAFQSRPELSGLAASDISGGWQPAYAMPDAQLTYGISVAGNTAPVDVIVNYYQRGAKGHSLIESTNRLWDEDIWHPVGTDRASVAIGGADADFSELLIASRTEQRLIWWSYWKDGRFTTSGTAIKLMSLKGMFRKADGAALVTISTAVDGTLDEARLRLSAALPALNELPQRLAAVAQ